MFRNHRQLSSLLALLVLILGMAACTIACDSDHSERVGDAAMHNCAEHCVCQMPNLPAQESQTATPEFRVVDFAHAVVIYRDRLVLASIFHPPRA